MYQNIEIAFLFSNLLLFCVYYNVIQLYVWNPFYFRTVIFSYISIYYFSAIFMFHTKCLYTVIFLSNLSFLIKIFSIQIHNYIFIDISVKKKLLTWMLVLNIFSDTTPSNHYCKMVQFTSFEICHYLIEISVK